MWCSRVLPISHTHPLVDCICAPPISRTHPLVECICVLPISHTHSLVTSTMLRLSLTHTHLLSGTMLRLSLTPTHLLSGTMLRPSLVHTHLLSSTILRPSLVQTHSVRVLEDIDNDPLHWTVVYQDKDTEEEKYFHFLVSSALHVLLVCATLNSIFFFNKHGGLFTYVLYNFVVIDSRPQ